MNSLNFSDELLKLLEENPKTKAKINLLNEILCSFPRIFNEDGSIDLNKLHPLQPELQTILSLLGEISIVVSPWLKDKDKIYIENYFRDKNFNFEIKDSEGEFISFQLNSDNNIYFELYPDNNYEWKLLKVGSEYPYWKEKVGNLNDEKIEQMLNIYMKISNSINNNNEE